jgi:hypothetical protein
MSFDDVVKKIFLSIFLAVNILLFAPLSIVITFSFKNSYFRSEKANIGSDLKRQLLVQI